MLRPFWGTFTTMVEYKDRLEQAMKKSGVTTTALAASLDVSYQAVKKVLDGSTRAFTAANNARAAAVLKVNPNWLATGEGEWEDVGAPLASRADAPKHSARVLVEQLANLASDQRPTLRKNLGNLLVELVEHPDDPDVVEQTIADIERFYK